MHFIVGAVLLGIGIRLFRRLKHSIPEQSRSSPAPLSSEQQQWRELQMDVALHALNREQRAKNALIAVLRKYEHTEEEIEVVLASIDAD